MQVQIDFTIERLRENGEIDNNEFNIICHLLCEMFEDCGYGEIIYDGTGLHNTYATPYTIGNARISETSVFFGYTFDINNDSNHGDLAFLLTRGIPEFHRALMNHLHNVNVDIRVYYIPVRR